MSFTPQLWEGFAEERLLTPWEVVAKGLSFDRGWYESQSIIAFNSPTMGRIEVPLFRITDHASIPHIIAPIIAPDHPAIALGSIIHDYLCECRGLLPNGVTYTIDQANRVLAFECMESCGATQFQKDGVYDALRNFGFKF